MPNFVFDHLGGMVPPEADNAALIYPPVLTPLQHGHLDPEQAKHGRTKLLLEIARSFETISASGAVN
jgi:hypothetical protein